MQTGGDCSCGVRPLLSTKGWLGKQPGRRFGIELFSCLLSRETTTGSGSPLRVWRVGDVESI